VHGGWPGGPLPVRADGSVLQERCA
jgi:hypothetical protein